MKHFSFNGRTAVLFCAIFSLLCIVSCKQETNYDDEVFYEELSADKKIIGTWKSNFGEIFEISKDCLKNGGSWGACYAGNEMKIQKISETSGYLYFKYTRAANPDWTYSEDAADVGKWYAIFYKDLSDKAVQIAGAAGKKSACDSLVEAVKEFSVENGYFEMFSECERQ